MFIYIYIYHELLVNRVYNNTSVNIENENWLKKYIYWPNKCLSFETLPDDPIIRNEKIYLIMFRLNKLFTFKLIWNKIWIVMF